jgi:hypothetical protein
VGLSLAVFLQRHREALGLGTVLGAHVETGDEASDSAELGADLGVVARGFGMDFTAVRPRSQGRRVAVVQELRALAAEGGFPVVALGHTLEDDACKVLTEVLHHGEVRAVRGFSPRVKGAVLRPVLRFSAAEVFALGATNWSPWSPADEPRREAHLARRLLPALRAYHPGVDRALARLGRSARRYQRELRARAAGALTDRTAASVRVLAPIEGGELALEAAAHALRALGAGHGDSGARAALARFLRGPSRGPADRLLGASLRARWVPEAGQVILQWVPTPVGRGRDGG